MPSTSIGPGAKAGRHLPRAAAAIYDPRHWRNLFFLAQSINLKTTESGILVVRYVLAIVPGASRTTGRLCFKPTYPLVRGGLIRLCRSL